MHIRHKMVPYKVLHGAATGGTYAPGTLITQVYERCTECGKLSTYVMNGQFELQELTGEAFNERNTNEV